MREQGDDGNCQDCEDRIGTSPPQVIHVALRYWAISGSTHPKEDPFRSLNKVINEEVSLYRGMIKSRETAPAGDILGVGWP